MNRTAGGFVRGTIIGIGVDDTMKNAWELMGEHEIRHLIVFDEDKEMVGILSDRDCRLAMRAHVDVSSGVRRVEIEFNKGDIVRDYMSSPVECAEIETTTRFVAEKMVRLKISAVIVTRNGKAVGIITYEDLLKEYIMILNEYVPKAA